MRREETEANCAVRLTPGGRGLVAGGRAEHGALAWRVPHGPSSLTLPPPVPGGQATSEVRSSRWEDPRAPGGSGDEGCVPASAAGGSACPMLRPPQRGRGVDGHS